MDINSLYFLQKVKDKLIDQESLNIYEARLQYYLDRNAYNFYNRTISENTVFSTITKFDSFYNQFSEAPKIVLFGAGNYGKHALNILKHSKYADSVFAFCDDNEFLWGTTVASIPVISPKELLSHRKHLVVITTPKHLNTIYESLLWREYPYQRIFYPPLRFLYAANSEWIYFDVFEPHEHEIFVDAGCCNGRTSLQFIKWCKGDYRNIYAFEPSIVNISHCEATLKNIDNCKLINKGVWSKKDELFFQENPIISAGSRIAANGKIKVPVIDIDSVLDGNPATFIKMDVEGCELEALKGAKETIIKYHPRLAISIYHKPEDIFEIPAYIVQLNNKYDFCLRHYSSGLYDTILYAL